jgi:2-dehydropantoate 2-reductase
MLGMKSNAGSEIPGMFDISIGAGRETIAVGNKLGFVAEPVFGLTAEEFMGSTDEMLRTILKTILSHVGPQSRNAVVQDHMKGRRSEVDYINGVVARHGRAVGIPTPYNDAICEITRRITSGELKPDPSNVARLQGLLP